MYRTPRCNLADPNTHLGKKRKEEETSGKKSRTAQFQFAYLAFYFAQNVFTKVQIPITPNLCVGYCHNSQEEAKKAHDKTRIGSADFDFERYEFQLVAVQVKARRRNKLLLS